MVYPTPGFVVRKSFLEFEPEDKTVGEETQEEPPRRRAHSDSDLLSDKRPPEIFGSEELRLAFESQAGRSTVTDPENSPRTRGSCLTLFYETALPSPRSGDEAVLDDDPNAVSSTSPPEELRTTLMLEQVPSEYTRDKLKAKLDSEGFAASYDFIFVPMDMRTRTGQGHALINFRTSILAKQALVHFQSQELAASWSQWCQGFTALVERYRNSPVMHGAVADICKPVVFDACGKPEVFPEPTRRLRMPRVRKGRLLKAKAGGSAFDGDTAEGSQQRSSGSNDPLFVTPRFVAPVKGEERSSHSTPVAGNSATDSSVWKWRGSGVLPTSQYRATWPSSESSTLAFL